MIELDCKREEKHGSGCSSTDSSDEGPGSHCVCVEDGCNVAWPKFFSPLGELFLGFRLCKDYRSSTFNDSLCSVIIVHDVIQITSVFLQKETDELSMLHVENEVHGY